MKNFYSIREAADYLQVDYKVVYRLVRQGDIPSTRVGWQYRMTQEDLNTYLNVQRAKQTSSHSSAPTYVEQHKPLNGEMTMTSGEQRASTNGSISKVQARQMEQNLINRFNQKVRSIDTIRHPSSQKMLHVDNWEEIYSKEEDREAMMRALNTAFLERATLATTPRNTRIFYTIAHTPNLVIGVRFVSHLERFCQDESDEQPATLEDLMVVIDELEEIQEESRAVTVTGLASPTGWDEDAIGYVVNTGRGNTYTHPQISIFLIDLRSEMVYYNEHDATSATFAGLFRLASEFEDQAALEEQLIAELADRSGLILSEFGRENEVSEELVLESARNLVSKGNYRLLEDKKDGWILVIT